MIEIFIVVIVGIAILVLASPNMKGRGYRGLQEKPERKPEQIFEDEQYLTRARSRYNY